MNEFRFVFTNEEMVSDLRSLGLTVEERDVERFCNREAWLSRMWMVLNESTGNWVNALDVYRALLEKSFKRATLGNVTRFDVLDCFK